MRVLSLSTWCPYPPINGSQLRAYHLIKALSRHHDVTLISFQPEAAPQDSPYPPLNLHACSLVAEDPFRATRVPPVVRYLAPIPLAAWPNSKMYHTVRDVCASLTWDAVVAFQMPVAPYALVARSAVKLHDMDAPFSSMALQRLRTARTAMSRAVARLSYWKTKSFESWLAGKFTVCTVASPLETDWARQVLLDCSRPVELCPNGVDCEHNRPGLAWPQPGALVYTGALTYAANYDAMRWFLADIYPIIRREEAQATLTITGSTAGVDLTALALHNTVHLTGCVDDVRVPIAMSSVCVAPIREGSGTRLKVLEAMALGTPVVATPKAVEGLEVRPDEHLLIARDPSAFSAAVLRLLRDPDLRARMTFQARRLVEEKYDWRMVGEGFVTLLERFVGAGLGAD